MSCSSSVHFDWLFPRRRTEKTGHLWASEPLVLLLKLPLLKRHRATPFWLWIVQLASWLQLDGPEVGITLKCVPFYFLSSFHEDWRHAIFGRQSISLPVSRAHSPQLSNQAALLLRFAKQRGKEGTKERMAELPPLLKHKIKTCLEFCCCCLVCQTHPFTILEPQNPEMG